MPSQTHSCALLVRVAAVGCLLLPGCAVDMGATSQTAMRYGQEFFGQKVPDVARNVNDSVLRLIGRGDGSFWNADDIEGRPSLRIHLGEQRVYFFKGGQLAGASPISSGSEGYGTRPGSYRVIEKDIGHKSSIYGDYEDYFGNVVMQNIDNRKDPRPPGTRFEGAKMYYFMRIYGAVGMHQGYLPGYPASHGCIRLPKRMAPKFFEACPLGTPVEIVR